MIGNQNAEEKTGFLRSRLLWNGIVIVLCAILFLQVITFIKEAADYHKVYTVDESVLLQMLTGRQYDSLVENVYRNEAHGVSVSGDMEQIYAAAYYYEAAMLYHAHRKSGNVRQAEEAYVRMQEYEGQLGEYAFVKEEIREFLGMDLLNLK